MARKHDPVSEPLSPLTVNSSVKWLQTPGGWKAQNRDPGTPAAVCLRTTPNQDLETQMEPASRSIFAGSKDTSP